MEAGNFRAIDLYAGVGGWSLGLRLAGIEVVASYDRWGAANETNFKNNSHSAQTIDVRRLSPENLPDNIQVVVGSPPCTQFSFSNRGGNGDLDDGLQDIIKFFEIVDHIRPKFWAMENVPRIKDIIERELHPNGRLHRFAHLGINAQVVNMEEYGLPQRRIRCIVGNFDFAILNSYKSRLPRRTLGQVINALNAPKEVVDPIYGITLSSDALSDHVAEFPLNEEEIRINRANKVTHPVYNAMPFPDRQDRSVRTITATCTRVSRESIVISCTEDETCCRRLTIRERACLQGFPVHFQFYGDNYGQKLRMVGNAIPPAFTYYVAHAFLGTAMECLPSIESKATGIVVPKPPAKETPPDRPGKKYVASRTFKFAIPSLRLKSGVRFELCNKVGKVINWQVSFYFGTSKHIHSILLDGSLAAFLKKRLPEEVIHKVSSLLGRLEAFIEAADVARMQTLWSHRGVGRTRPFMLLDELDDVGAELIKVLSNYPDLTEGIVRQVISREHSGTPLRGVDKLLRNSSLILAGFFVGALANEGLKKHQAEMAAPVLPRAATR